MINIKNKININCAQVFETVGEEVSRLSSNSPVAWGTPNPPQSPGQKPRHQGDTGDTNDLASTDHYNALPRAPQTSIAEEIIPQNNKLLPQIESTNK